MVLAVDPEYLHRAADEVRVAAFDIEELLKTHGSRLGVPGQRTWESACQLATATEVWGDHLGRLAADLHRAATVLASVADVLIAADRAARSGIQDRTALAGIGSTA
jgi:hypothetical protein